LISHAHPILVVGAEQVKGLLEVVGKEDGLALDHEEDGEEGLLDLTAELALDGLLDVLAGDLGILLEGGSQLMVAAGSKDLVELALVVAPVSLACLF